MKIKTITNDNRVAIILETNELVSIYRNFSRYGQSTDLTNMLHHYVRENDLDRPEPREAAVRYNHENTGWYQQEYQRHAMDAIEAVINPPAPRPMPITETEDLEPD